MLSILLLFLSWPICLIHRFWNNDKPNPVNLFIVGVKKSNGHIFKQDIQWYIYDTGNMLSTSFIILSFIILNKKTKNYNIAISTVFLISLIDIIHYWICFKQNEFIVTLEGLMMLMAALLILYRKWKKG